MPATCIASNCRNRSGRFFALPRNHQRKEIWLERINRKDLPISKHGNAKLCENHFSEQQFEQHRQDNLHRLKPNAVPDLSCEGFNSPRRVMIRAQEKISQHVRDQLSKMNLKPLKPRIPVESKEVIIPGSGVSSIISPKKITGTVETVCGVEVLHPSEDPAPETLSKLCRLCASSSVGMVLIYSEEGMKQKLWDMIDQHLPIMVREDDRLPLQVCKFCVSLLNNCSLLMKCCVDSDSKLKLMLDAEDKKTADKAKMEEQKMKTNLAQAVQILTDSSEQSKIQPGVPIPLLFIDYSQLTTLSTTEKAKYTVISEKLVQVDKALPHQAQIVKVLETLKAGEQNLNTTSKEKTSSSAINSETVKSSPEIVAAKIFGDVSSPEFLCKHCNCVLQTASKLFDHQMLKFLCKFCKKLFCSDNERRKHYRNQHKSNFCSICKQMLSTRKEILRHQEMCTLVKDQNVICKKATEESDNNILAHVHATIVCELCDKTFNTRSTYVEHMTFHKEECLYTCELCHDQFKTLLQLNNHKRDHLLTTKNSLKTPKNVLEAPKKYKYSCATCNKEFMYLYKLKKHMICHSSEKPFGCTICPKTFADKRKLTIHVSAVHSNRDIRFSCDKCGFQFLQKRNLSHHFKTKHLDHQYVCTICRKIFPSKNSVQTHCNSSFHSHEEISKREVKGLKPFQKVTRFQCDICGKYLCAKVALERHKNLHKERPVRRNYVEFKSRQTIYNESIKAGKLIELGEESLTSFVCEICGFELFGKSALTKHMQSEHNKDKPERPYKCETCNKAFAQSHQLKLHMWHHTGVKPFSCLYCEASFTTRTSQVEHVRRHLGEKPFVCKICSKSYHSLGILKGHMKTHKNVLPFECPYCEKKFMRKFSLELHIRIHTGVRPYKCDICGNTFCQKISMDRHRLTHTHEKAYKCKKCNFACDKLKILREHEAKTHTHLILTTIRNTSSVPKTPTIEMFQCKHCSFQSTNQDTLLEHEASTHMSDIILVSTTEDIESCCPKITIQWQQNSSSVSDENLNTSEIVHA